MNTAFDSSSVNGRISSEIQNAQGKEGEKSCRVALHNTKVSHIVYDALRVLQYSDIPSLVMTSSFSSFPASFSTFPDLEVGSSKKSVEPQDRDKKSEKSKNCNKNWQNRSKGNRTPTENYRKQKAN